MVCTSLFLLRPCLRTDSFQEKSFLCQVNKFIEINCSPVKRQTAYAKG